MDKLIEKWKNSGLLEGLNDNQIIEMVILLEETYSLISEDMDYELSVLIMPTIRRLYNQFNKMFIIEDMVKEFKQRWEDFQLTKH
nr:hypothetical protein [Candidatus Dadabacteria bacterium]